ncbi:hypothetical protein MKW98_013729 [Papaver atlanticum]|uniref:PORR domain-containing protein n=1 Tax=Papaver atlanticum TaxID=357466 RepID=A0AAD4SEZ5_9MAGN|nr:hypothetical protein MKW98_013729 [Papaver atlanticum]
MNLRRNTLVCLLKFQSSFSTQLHQHIQTRGLVKVRLKWAKNKGFDHIINLETDVKAACLLKDAIKRSSTGFITAKTVSDWQKLLGLTVPVLRFMRRYPTIFDEFPHTRWPSLPCFRLTDTAHILDSQEQNIHQTHEANTVERLSRLLMMLKTRTIPFQSLQPLKWDLGLADDFDRTLIPKYPDHFQVIKASNGTSSLSLAQWREEYAVSELQRANESIESSDGYRQFKSGGTSVAFPMSFPKCYGAQKKVKAWMDDFQKLPYISPYEESAHIDPNSDLMEKRVVGVLHELLSLTIHKKTKRNYLRCLREEMNLPHKFTRIFTRYPGIFYLSLKCKTTTITLKEGYNRGKLVDEHPLASIRKKYYYVMRTGILYRGKGVNLITGNKDGEFNLVKDRMEFNDDDEEEEEEEEEEMEFDNDGEDSADFESGSEGE